MKDEWIEKLRSRLENHEETPPQGLFADIQKKMSQQQKAPSASEKRRKLSASWFWTIPAAAAVVAIGFVVIGESNNAVALPAADEEDSAEVVGRRVINENTLATGFIITDLTAALSDEVKAEWAKQIPLRRGGTPEDVANVCTFLASDLSSYVSGQVIHCCGGMNM